MVLPFTAGRIPASPLPGVPEEVVLRILDYLLISDITYVVRVSRDFWRIGIPLIWKDLEEIEGNPHIQRLLSSGESSSAKNRTGSNLRGAAPDAYRPFVKSLTLRLNEDEDQNTSLYELLDDLSSQDVTALLPQLQRLRIVAIDVTGVEDNLGDLLHVLMAPTIKNFELAFNTNSRNTVQVSDNVVALCSVLSRLRHLKLKAFCITSSDRMIVESYKAEKAIQTVLGHQQALLNVIISDFPSRLTTSFRAASRLPHLDGIRLTATQRGWYGEPAHPDFAVARLRPIRSFANGTRSQPPSFPSLRHLMAVISAGDVERLLLSVSSTFLSSLELQVKEPSMKIGACFADIGRFEQLKTIWLDYPGLLGTWGDLTPILACHNVQNISVHGDCISAILGDEQLGLLARAWPFLKSLVVVDSCLERWRFDLESSCAWSRSPGPHIPLATLSGLGTFAAHCPSLTCLIIPIDARGTPDPTSLETIGHAVQKIGFPHSLVDPGEGEEQVARFISTMWPNHNHTEVIELDQRWEKVWAPTARVAGENEKRWDRIWELARTLAQAKLGVDADADQFNTATQRGLASLIVPPTQSFLVWLVSRFGVLLGGTFQ